MEKASLLRLRIGASERQNVLDHRGFGKKGETWTQQSVRKAGGEKTPESSLDRQARWHSGRVSKPVFLRIDFCVQNVPSNSPVGLRSSRVFFNQEPSSEVGTYATSLTRNQMRSKELLRVIQEYWSAIESG